MPLFESKRKKLTRQHLERKALLLNPDLDVSAACNAVRACEAGEIFESVFFDGQILLARDVVKIADLEQFVEG